MAQQGRIGSHATTVATDANGITRVTYHQTVVVEFSNTDVILRTGGWKSATTKTRMNQAARQFGLPYTVYQKAGEWYANTPGGVIPFASDTGGEVCRIARIN